MTEKTLLFMGKLWDNIMLYTSPILSWFSTPIDWPEWAGVPPDYWTSMTPLDLMIGSGLTFLLVFIVVKFFLDIIL